MAKALNSMLSLLTTLIILFSNHHVITTKANKYHQTLNPEILNLKPSREKLTHLKFYFHDVVSGKNPTAVRVAEAPTTNTSATLFGAIVIIDDPLTLGPDPKSPRLGSAQGFYSTVSQSDVVLLMVQNYVFTAGKFNGSTLSVLGRNAPFAAVRELPVVGGTGRFRFARGFALAKTHFYNATTGDAIVQYNVYVNHYY